MRVGTHLLATFGLAAALLSPAVAQDSSLQELEQAKTSRQYFSRNGGSATQPSIAETESADPPRIRRLIRPEALRQGNTFPLSGQPGTVPAMRRDYAVQPAGGIDEKSESRLVHARFQQDDSGSSAEIQQISVTADNTSPFAPAGERNNVDRTAVPAAATVADESAPSSLKGVRQGPDGPQTPSVTVQWRSRGPVNVGRPCEVELVVTNNGQIPAGNVVVDGWFPANVRLTEASPQPTDHKDHVSWSFETLAPGTEKIVQITLVPAQRGPLNTTAYVRFTGVASASFTAQEPLLKVALNGPTEVNIGEPASQTIVVSNPGTGVATNVTVQAALTSGLEHARGERLSINIGSLNSSETRMVRLPLSAVGGGSQKISVRVSADDVLAQTTSSTVAVIAPSLKVALDGPGLRYIGRRARYEMTIENDGAAASNNVRALYRVPAGFRFLTADRAGKYNEETRTIDWFVGRLEPGQKVACHVELAAEQVGKHVHLAGAISEHGSRAETRLPTEVDGTASLVLKIVDLDDPVEIGADTMYEVRVKNEGSKAAQNVGISCEVPQGVDFVKATGPADHIAENGLVVFKSLKELPPGETALFRVQVRGRASGNHRFRVRLASDSITEPLISEELTKFYGE